MSPNRPIKKNAKYVDARRKLRPVICCLTANSASDVCIISFRRTFIPLLHLCRSICQLFARWWWFRFVLIRHRSGWMICYSAVSLRGACSLNAWEHSAILASYVMYAPVCVWWRSLKRCLAKKCFTEPYCLMGRDTSVLGIRVRRYDKCCARRPA